MSNYITFFHNTLIARNRICNDIKLNNKVKSIIERGPENFDGSAFYKTIIKNDLGLKRREKEWLI